MKVLVATDAESSRELVDALRARKWSEKDSFLIVSVLDSSEVPYLERRQLGTKYLQQVESVAHDLQATFPKSRVTANVLTGLTAEAIADEAAQWQADLIVIGSHHKRGLTRLLEGSISESVMKASKCSIMLVPVGTTEAACQSV
ncbi:MAG TPA: universal stress protein [Oculatellaceae cyanobacterium]